LAVKKPCKKSADLQPRQGNLLHRNIFTGLNNLFITQNRLQILAEKIAPFSTCFFYRSSYDFYGHTYAEALHAVTNPHPLPQTAPSFSFVLLVLSS
jgi:hypothetical protein